MNVGHDLARFVHAPDLIFVLDGHRHGSRILPDTGLRTFRSALDRCDDRFCYFVDGAVSVNLRHDPLFLIAIDQWSRLDFIEIQPLGDRFWRVVRSLADRSAADVTDAVHRWGIEMHVVDPSTHGADASPG